MSLSVSLLAGQGISAPSKKGAMFDELIAHNLVEATSEKAAIWDVKVCANSDWQSGKFTMLKIRPSVIWENVDQRPELFDGSVLQVDKEGNVLPTAEAVESKKKVLIAFTIDNLWVDTFVYDKDSQYHKKGDVGAMPKGRLINIKSITVDGEKKWPKAEKQQQTMASCLFLMNLIVKMEISPQKIKQ